PDIAEFTSSRQGCSFSRFTTLKTVALRHFEMGANLFFKLLFPTTTPELELHALFSFRPDYLYRQ
ncbi:MAG: hypothetical protein J2P31_16450, partial [Blastocatellia bacterium]|nr:hypothetical protein [Blastocatellia bacterium]